MKIKGKVRYVFFGLFLLALFHFESLHIGPLKVSHLWKGALLAYLLLVLTRGAKIKPYIYGPLLLLSIMQIFNMELVNNPFNAVLLFSTTSILPMLGMYAFRFSPEQLQKGLLFFASFFILSFVPYKLGLVSSINDGYRLSSYGVEESGGLIGPFQTVHSASTALAAALLVVVYFYFVNSYNKIYLSLLFVLGFYFLFATYVRTGMLMFALGLAPIIFHFGKKNSRTFLRLVLAGSVTSVLVGAWVLSNETLMDRITGKRVNQSEFSSIENLGSGRGLIYLSALDTYYESNSLEKFIGVGQTAQKEGMKERIGLALIPHNGFLLILLNNGVFGLLVFFIFLGNIRKQGLRSKENEVVLLKALFLAYLVMTFFQNFDILYATLLLFITVALNVKARDSLERVANENTCKHS